LKEFLNKHASFGIYLSNYYIIPDYSEKSALRKALITENRITLPPLFFVEPPTGKMLPWV
jgi:hypothetical protein